MDGCCEIRPVHARRRRVLVVVLCINVVMFLAELVGGLIAHSTARLADAVDMLASAIVYGVSLYVIGRAPFWQSRTALLKGFIMAGFALGIVVEVVLKVVKGLTPDAGIMWPVAVAALVANGSVLVFLSRPSGRRHQHAVRVDLLKERRHRQCGGSGGRAVRGASAAPFGPTSS